MYAMYFDPKRKVNRKEILEKKKAIDELIKAASAVKDPLSPFLSSCYYNSNGMSFYLESGRGSKLSAAVKQYIQNLLKVNMEEPYGSEWPLEEKVKRREMVSSEARYIFAYEGSSVSSRGISSTSDREMTSTNFVEERGHPMVAFVHYRFTLEEGIPVLYVYELQIEPRVQGRGLGKSLMHLIELIAHKNRMDAVVLTVQKANTKALTFYMSTLRYTISTISPSRVDPMVKD